MRKIIELACLAVLSVAVVLATVPAAGAAVQKDSVKKAQEALQKQGFDPGPADGILGGKTKAALRDYQKIHGLEATGMPDEATLVSLGVIKPARAPAAPAKPAPAVPAPVTRARAASPPAAAVSPAEKLADHLMATKKYAEAAKAYKGLLDADKANDRVRNKDARALLLSGNPDGAVATWRGAKSDEMRTEFMYLATVVSRYEQAGSPTTSKLVPSASSLDDEALVGKIVEASRKFAEVRSVYLKKKKAADEAARAKAEADLEAKRNLSPEEVKKRIAEKRKEVQVEKEKDPNAFNDPNHPYWKKLREQRLAKLRVTSDFPEPPDVKEASKTFFYLMEEYVKRGHLLRDFCFQHGLIDLVFH